MGKIILLTKHQRIKFSISNRKYFILVFAKDSILRDRPTNEREALVPAPKVLEYTGGVESAQVFLLAARGESNHLKISDVKVLQRSHKLG